MISTINKEAIQAVDFKELKITSPAFGDGDLIPSRYTCDGKNVNPPLNIHGIPATTKSLAVIVTGTYDEKEEWAHWLAWNITPVSHISEDRHMEIEGLNYFGRKRYEGPCPVGGLHKYHFKVYALDSDLHINSCAAKNDLERAISDHILGFGVITGLYQRHINPIN